MTDAVEKVAVSVGKPRLSDLGGLAPQVAFAFRAADWPGLDAKFSRQPRPRRLRKRRLPPVGRRPESSQRHGLKVLHDGGEMELIARAGKPTQPHAFEAVINL